MFDGIKPFSGNEESEAAIQELGLEAPRITITHAESRIVREDYHRFPGTQVTVCCLVLDNGFTAIGYSACVSPENFNEEFGKREAKTKALDEVWKLCAHDLAWDLHLSKKLQEQST